MLVNLVDLVAKSLFIFFLSFCCISVFAGSTYDKSWQTPERQDHPWVGKVWSHVKQDWVSHDKLVSEIQGADFILIGEKHDNQDHHSIQHWLLKQTVDSKSKVVFEMLLQQQSDIALYGNTELPKLEKQLNWSQLNKGWPWSFYGPLIKEVVGRGGEFRGASYSREKLMSVYRGEIPAHFAEIYDRSFSGELHKVLEKDIEVSHCDKLPKSQISPMVSIQRLRDIAMVTELVNGTAQKSNLGVKAFTRSILIAGNFHVRKDVGVPYYLQFFELPKAAKTLSLSIQEVPKHSQKKPEDSPTLHMGPQLAPQKQSTQYYDFVWYTPAVASKDYCADL